MIVRFLGDPTGYRLVVASSDPPTDRWQMAYVGRSTRKVWIDVAKAYLIELVV